MSDIFKDMQAKVGCDYLSDLPSYKRKVWHEMKRLNPADYEERPVSYTHLDVYKRQPYYTMMDAGSKIWICRNMYFLTRIFLC